MVRYDRNILGKVPNFMTCVVPRPEAEEDRGDARRVQKGRISDRFERRNMEKKDLKVGDKIGNFLLSPFRSKEQKERIRAMSGGNSINDSSSKKREKRASSAVAKDPNELTLFGGVARRLSLVGKKENPDDTRKAPKDRHMSIRSAGVWGGSDEDDDDENEPGYGGLETDDHQVRSERAKRGAKRRAVRTPAGATTWCEAISRRGGNYY